ncbi:leucyl aminopeptidase [Acidomonas methanolica]|uniref:Probable cytosol aminopeptidase n=3 Tax=Acidomonas methanolica TaxID=437 RepID=A0A023D521_ACIMT|nr:leucyl aminopeptidase [Acidomonas methanolica]MBU2654351.1 leucyl aminopeptidase [Acidomonas methanolica]TCS28439.1 leucyl aminopeptidase [Acidomonas methanolica]GAJ29222.1 leucyl aminopeptidase [Acidomonas methanolica NBRC 104435]GEK99578.1 putative cytosol aminopeptidase [Acidomonas methanolica NBRC 104435]
MLDVQIRPRLSLEAEGGEAPLSLALFVGRGFENGEPLFEALDRLSAGAVRRAVILTGFEGDAEQSCVLLAPTPFIERLVLIGCGGADAPEAVALEAAGALAARLLRKAGEAHFLFAAEFEGHAAHAAYGAVLGQYAFTPYRTQKPAGSTPLLAMVTLHVNDKKAVEADWTGLEAVARGVMRTRDLVSEPPNVLTPPEFARRIEALRDLGVEIESFDESALQDLGFGAMLGVAQGSEAGARLVVMRWRGGRGDGDEAPAVFVGKGVTFDSGGISIKPAGGMEEMKTDMAGAAVVVGLMETLARRGAKAHVVGLVGLVENMLSGGAQRPGDVVRSYSGQTIEVLNTDAEGRLVLADVLAYARARFSPAFMVDLATLTGAIVVSLGHVRAGLFSNDDALAGEIFARGEAVGEPVWRMPMGKPYDKLLRSDIADMKNIGGRPGGSITAAQFLARFVGETPWAHLDIAGVAWRGDAGPIGPKGATGFGVRLLDALVREHVEGRGA